MGGGLLLSGESPIGAAPRRLAILVLSIGSCWTFAVWASPLTYSVGYGLQYSSNIHQSEHDRVSDSVSLVSAHVAYQQMHADALTRLRIGAVYQNYHKDTFDDDVNLLVDGAGEWYIQPQLLSWVATESFRKVQVSPTGPNTPNNLQDSNIFTTGPNLYLHLGERDKVVVEGRYGDVFIAGTNLDNVRKFGAVRWIHQPSLRHRIAANYEYMAVEFKETGANNYSRNDGFITLTYLTNRTEFGLEAGLSRAELDIGDSFQGFRGRIELSQQLSSFSRAGIRYFQEYSDTGLELLATGITSAPGDVGRSGNVALDVVSRDIFYNKQSELYYRRTESSVPWGIRLFFRDVDFASEAGDREESGATFDLNYSPTPTTTISLFSFYRWTDYLDTLREDRDSESGIALVWQMGRRLSSRFEYRNIARESTALGAGFDDSRVTVSISYGTTPTSAAPAASMIR